MYRAPLQQCHDIPNAIGFLSWHLSADSNSQDKAAWHRPSRQSEAEAVPANRPVHSLPHPQGHQGRNPLHHSCPSVLPRPVLGTKQQGGISPVLRMALSLLTCSRSPPCQLAPGRAGQDRAALGRFLCLWAQAMHSSPAWLPPRRHSHGQRCSALSAPRSWRFNSPSGLWVGYSITSVIRSSCRQSQRKARLVHMQVSTHTVSCQSHTWHGSEGEKFDPEHGHTSTTQPRSTKHTKRNREAPSGFEGMGYIIWVVFPQGEPFD